MSRTEQSAAEEIAVKHCRTNVLITRPFQGLHDALPLLPIDRFDVCPCPTISVRPALESPLVDEVFYQIATFDFAIFTSQIAAIETINYVTGLGIDLDQFNRMRVCAVGPVTAKTLEKSGIQVDLIPNRYTAKALADLFPAIRTHTAKVLFPRGNRASDTLRNDLSSKGYDVVSPVIYETEPRTRLEQSARRLISTAQVDCVAFTSPSSVFALRSLLGEEGFRRLIERATVAAIGPVTSAACVEAGACVEIEPEEYTLRALANDIACHFDAVLQQSAFQR